MLTERSPSSFTSEAFPPSSKPLAARLPKGGHIAALDGLRGIAIIFVLYAHYGLAFLTATNSSLEAWLHRLSFWGGSGVDLFFVLSGFLITRILLGTLGSGSYFRTFYMRRSLRIFPLYYAFLFICYFPIRRLNLRIGFMDFLGSYSPSWFLLYASNFMPNRGTSPGLFSHLWSLAVEEQFYMVWPAIVFFLAPRKYLVPLCLFGIVACQVLRGYMEFRGSWWESIHRLTFVRADTFLMGALAAISFRDDRLRPIVLRFVPITALISAAGLLVLISLKWRGGVSVGWFWDSVQPFLFTTFYACAVFWASCRGESNPFFNSHLLRTVGKFSYGLYMWHMLPMPYLALMISSATLAGRVSRIAGCLFLSIGIAQISWLVLENPFLKQKKYFPYAVAKSRTTHKPGRNH